MQNSPSKAICKFTLLFCRIIFFQGFEIAIIYFYTIVPVSIFEYHTPLNLEHLKYI